MKTIDRETYNSLDYSSFSGLKTFSICPKLYHEQYVLKTYTEPDRDYFIYGSLVDAIVTQPETVADRFIQVDRRADPEKGLHYEERIKELTSEIYEQKDAKGKSLQERAEEGNKTAVKGKEKREQEIEDLKARIRAVRERDTKIQITPALWTDAHETAESIKANPFFKTLVWDEFSSQQIIVDVASGRKGILDYMRLSPTAQKLYGLWKIGAVSTEEYRARMAELSPQDRRGVIVDIKTTAQLSKLDPLIYANQLAWYRKLVETMTNGIVCKCFIIVGDKDPEKKKTQDFEYAPALLDQALDTVCTVEKAFLHAKKHDAWAPAKQLRGRAQTCFRCSMCSERPFSMQTSLLVR